MLHDQLPGELVNIVRALELALSSVESERTAALEHLQSWSALPGFFLSLLRISTLPDSVLGENARVIRLQACLQFKNGIDRHWRKTSSQPIHLDEKAQIRSILMANNARGDLRIAKTTALAIAKIARLDYGTDWNTLPEELLSVLRSNASNSGPDGPDFHETLLKILHVTKSLSSNRMPKGRALMSHYLQHLSPALLELLQAKFVELRATQPVSSPAAESATLLMRILIAFVASSNSSLEEAQLQSFFDIASQQASALYDLLRQPAIASDNRSAALLHRLILKHVKLFRLVGSDQPSVLANETLNARVRNFAMGVVQDAAAQPESISENSLPCERVVVQSILSLQMLLGDWARGPLCPTLPDGFVVGLTNQLVTRLLPLRTADLDAFSDDPEEWIKDFDAERQEFDLRPAVEFTLQAIFSQYADDLRPALLSLVQQDQFDSSAIFEAVLTALGLAAEQLREHLDFASWFRQRLAPQLRDAATPQLIKMRIVWLLGRFGAHDLPPGLHGEVYEALALLLEKAPGRALATRLMAVKSLIKCDSWDLNENAFASVLPRIVDSLILLMGETELPDTHLSLNQLFGIIIDRFGPQMTNVSARLVEILVGFWHNNPDSHFQASLLSTITKAVEVNNQVSLDGTTNACRDLIDFSVNRSNAAFVYLHEDAIELWLALVKQSTRMDDSLIALVSRLPELITDATDTLHRVLRVCESYLLLDADATMKVAGNASIAAFNDIAFDVKAEALRRILATFDLLVRLTPSPLWLPFVEASGMIEKMLKQVFAEESAVNASMYLVTLARMCLTAGQTFAQTLDRIDQRSGQAQGTTAQHLVNQWMDKFDNIAESSSRKVLALASSTLCSASLESWNSAPALAFIWSSALAQTEEEDNGDAEIYRHDDYDPEADISETNETLRRRQATAADPVHSVRLKEAIANAVILAQQLADASGGGSLRARFIDGGRVDPTVWDEIEKRLFSGLAG